MGKNKIDWGSDDDFIQKYLELKSSRKMGEYYNCDKSSVLNHCKKIGFDINQIDRGYKLSDQDKQEIINLYNSATSSELANKYNVTRGMITKIWYDADLKGKEIDNSNKGNNLINQKFGYLTVVGYSEKRSSSGSKYWLCECNCGKENCLKTKEIEGQSLLSNKTISCGTVSKENLKIGQGLNFKDLTGQTFGKLIVLNRIEDKELSNGSKKVQYKCKCSCGNITNVLSDNLKKGNTQTCGFCNENSHGNIKIAQILDKANIYYEREKRFDSCIDKTFLPFDFYVDNKYLIEYDGIQHFDNNRLYDYKSTHKHDLIKNKWCEDNNVPLIRIPYTHYNNLCLEDLLLETSKFIEK